MFDVLALAPYRGCGQCLVGSLTGAVSSQSVTEEHEGGLRPITRNGTERPREPLLQLYIEFG